MWRLFQGVLDPENEGTDAKGVVKRVDHVRNSLLDAALAFSAGQLAWGSEDEGGGSPDDWTARLMAQSFVGSLTVVVGAVIVGAGFYQFHRAYRADSGTSSNQVSWASGRRSGPRAAGASDTPREELSSA
jgi:uncharacterized protein DUF1206